MGVAFGLTIPYHHCGAHAPTVRQPTLHACGNCLPGQQCCHLYLCTWLLAVWLAGCLLDDWKMLLHSWLTGSLFRVRWQLAVLNCIDGWLAL